MSRTRTNYLYGLVFILLLILFSGQLAKSQVEHNYPVGPQSTDCDSLRINALPVEEAIGQLEKTTFRFQQQFQLSRTEGMMLARFLSCDGETGYLLMRVDRREMVFLDVPKTIWDRLIASSDVNSFYEAHVNGRFDAIR